eukprot:2562451-Heterocapsa_arctica.AAC.1
MPAQVLAGGGKEQEVIRELSSSSTKWENQPDQYDLLVPHAEVERPPIRIHGGTMSGNNLKKTKRTMTEEQL